LIETLAIGVGTSIIKSVLKLWLKDYSIASEVSSSLADVLKSQISDRLTQRRAQRQFEEIGERIGQSLLPIFQMEGANLHENERIAVAEAVESTLNAITSRVLAQNNLDPLTLAKLLLERYPPETHLFNETEGELYRRVIAEACTYIVGIASNLPTF